MYFYNDYTQGFNRIEVPETPTVEDPITSLYCRTAEILYRVRNARQRLKEAVADYEYAKIGAYSVTGIRYDRDKIQKTPDPVGWLIEVIEAYDACNEALQEYILAKYDTKVLIDISRAATREKELLMLRYCNDRDLTFKQIAMMMGITTHFAKNLHKRAFCKVANFLNAQGVA